MSLPQALSERVARGALRMLPPPQAALRLREVISAPGRSLQQVVAAVMLDPLLALVVMRRANSNEFAPQGPTTSLMTAVHRLGERELFALASAAERGTDAMTPRSLRRACASLVRRALISAHVGERIAHAFGVHPQTAFVAGLLHDVGALVALNTLALLVDQLGGEERDPQAWLQLARAHDQAIGALVCRRWALPDSLVEAITYERDGAAEQPALSKLLWVAEELVDGLEAEVSIEELTGSPRLEALMPSREVRVELIRSLEALPALVAALVLDGPDPLMACAALVSVPEVEVEGQWFEARLSRERSVRVLLDGEGVPRLVEGPQLTSGLQPVTLDSPEGPLQLWLWFSEPLVLSDTSRATALAFALDARLKEALTRLVEHARGA